MRLRLRSVDSKETLKIEVPNRCSLPQFKQIVARLLPDSPSPDSICLSLNRKDQLQSDGEDALQSLGVAAGDLIFFSVLNPVGFNSQTRMESEIAKSSGVLISHHAAHSFDSTAVETQSKMEIDVGDTGTLGVSDIPAAQGSDSASVDAHIVGDSEKDETLGVMETDEIISPSSRSFSMPGFLRQVLTEELSDEGMRDHKLIIIAVHAVMLESGFVAFDKNSNMVTDGLSIQNGWSSRLFSLALHYTLPEAIGASEIEATKTVVLKFQCLGDFINIFGTSDLDSVTRNVYRVQLNETKLIPHLNIVWANCWDMENSVEVGGASMVSPEKEVFKFWKTLKDSLALPLSIDLCEAAGLQLPPCFMRLPTDLKLKILESLPGVILARIICVCLELRYLGSNDDLWKLKFSEEFPDRRRDNGFTWKRAFAVEWTLRKAAVLVEQRGPMVLPAMYHNLPRRWYPNPFMVPRWPPRIIGGDYDISPPPFRGGIRRLGLNPMKPFSPTCCLGGNGGV